MYSDDNRFPQKQTGLDVEMEIKAPRSDNSCKVKSMLGDHMTFSRAKMF